ncbi:unnamed protein product [Phytophthora fragariaefolia]|uniref:ubiquitinyl hydrolase 1 n=1 Tax=Phytophthora fragariaefolia TaxID=1490495 RepID=A0A9W6XUJ6_9STRA|nr:unnamed protein product [Phytophthora fragariaefolia]
MAQQELYHERQQLYRCGLHALNNVLQGKSRLGMANVDRAGDQGRPRSEEWAHELGLEPSPIPTGTRELRCQCTDTCPAAKRWNSKTLTKTSFSGDRGLNIVVGYVMQWLDKRVPVDDTLVKLDEAAGVLCNVVMTTMLSSLWLQRHWFAIRKITGVCYNLDSKLPAPVVRSA